jgi:endonuclease YncB( thermonuclease family)
VESILAARTKKTTKNPGKLIPKKYIYILLVLLGALLGNLDRLGRFGHTAGKYGSFLPRYVRLLIPGFGAGYGAAESGTELYGKVFTVSDGDTITLLSPEGDQKYKVRFYGIDAPESSQPFGKESAAALSDMIDGKFVTVKVVTVDQYQRHVGKVFCGEQYVNLEMVKQGMAWHYESYAPRDYEIKQAQQNARRLGQGLWKQQRPQPPWEYRREKN